MKLEILYEDNHIIAVYKPAGMLVQGDHSGDPTLIDEVKYFIKQRDHKPGKVFLGLLHRLDRPVSGIVLFAKTSKGAARISEQFRNHTIEKIYHALVIGMPQEKSARLVHYLKKDADQNVVYAYTAPTEGAREAVLAYDVVDDSQNTKNPPSPLRRGARPARNASRSEAGGGEVQSRAFTLLKIRLETGRPHQIRAQLAAIGHPVLGDVKYGAPAQLPDRSLALCATELRFRLATKDETETITIQHPKDWCNIT